MIQFLSEKFLKKQGAIFGILFFLIIIIQQSCLAFGDNFVKQNDEFTCAPVSSYNLVREICPQCRGQNIENFVKLEKTDVNGTTSYNLCRGLEKYFKSQGLKSDIKYFGIKKVRKYKTGSEIDFKTLKKALEDGYGAIINFGVYSKNSEGFYVRQWGHYVNLLPAGENSLAVFDPYDKENKFSAFVLKKTGGVNLKNINDNENYQNLKEVYFVENKINYLQENEFAILNGVFLIKVFE